MSERWSDQIQFGEADERQQLRLRVGEKYFSVGPALHRILEQLKASDVSTDGAATLTFLQDRLPSGQAMQVQNQLLSFLVMPQTKQAFWQGLRRGFVKFPLLTPSEKLTAQFRGRVITFPVLATAALCGLFAFWMAATHAASLPQITTLDWKTLLALWIMVIVTTLIHELGHALVAAHYGIRTRSIGIALFFLQPAGYADISDTWLSTRKVRIIAALGGFLFQLFPLGLSALAWFFTRSDIFGLYAIINIGYFAINLIPFIRTDGYWLLANLIREDNLINKSNVQWNTLLKERGSIERLDTYNLMLAAYAAISKVYIWGLYLYSFGTLLLLIRVRINPWIFAVTLPIGLSILAVRMLLRARQARLGLTKGLS